MTFSALAAAVSLMLAFTLGGFTTPLVAEAQQSSRVYRIGFLYGPPVTSGAHVFEETLRGLGWVKGQNVAIEYRSADGHLDRLPALAAELVALRVDVIVANSAPETNAARQATRSIPIVFVVHGDPVGTGDVTSLARPVATLLASHRCTPISAASSLSC